jgi:hypothetical protein
MGVFPCPGSPLSPLGQGRPRGVTRVWRHRLCLQWRLLKCTEAQSMQCSVTGHKRCETEQVTIKKRAGRRFARRLGIRTRSQLVGMARSTAQYPLHPTMLAGCHTEVMTPHTKPVPQIQSLLCLFCTQYAIHLDLDIQNTARHQSTCVPAHFLVAASKHVIGIEQ